MKRLLPQEFHSSRSTSSHRHKITHDTKRSLIYISTLVFADGLLLGGLGLFADGSCFLNNFIVADSHRLSYKIPMTVFRHVIEPACKIVAVLHLVPLHGQLVSINTK